MSLINANITVNIEDFYNIVNVLRESCGCDKCLQIADNLLLQRNKEIKKGRFQ